MCVPINECEKLLSLLKQKPLPPETVDFLRRSQCGFEGRIPKVCCPNSPSWTAPVPVTKSPPSTTGYSPSVWDKKPEVQRQISGWESHPKSHLIPADRCGIDNSQRIWGGNRTDLEQYPWTALFQYQARKYANEDPTTESWQDNILSGVKQLPGLF